MALTQAHARERPWPTRCNITNFESCLCGIGDIRVSCVRITMCAQLLTPSFVALPKENDTRGCPYNSIIGAYTSFVATTVPETERSLHLTLRIMPPLTTSSLSTGAALHDSAEYVIGQYSQSRMAAILTWPIRSLFTHVAAYRTHSGHHSSTCLQVIMLRRGSCRPNQATTSLGSEA
jgi:hypothetical protein